MIKKINRVINSIRQFMQLRRLAQIQSTPLIQPYGLTSKIDTASVADDMELENRPSWAKKLPREALDKINGRYYLNAAWAEKQGGKKFYLNNAKSKWIWIFDKEKSIN